MLDWRRALVLTHRWLGVAGCLLFAAWFFSGVVMMYARMPVLAPEERLARAPVLDLSAATLSPAEAAAQWSASTSAVRVGMAGNRPVYRFGEREPFVIYADTGEPFAGFARGDAERIAAPYVPDDARGVRYEAYLDEPDQWTLGLQGLLPMHRLAVDDPAGTVIYVSDVSAQVELRTTRRERFWAYLGPVTHWVYFTPLRRHGQQWYSFIVWSSLFGCVMCVAGLAWGLMRFSPRGFRLRGRVQPSPYAGLLMWHHYAGLVFGLITLTWAYSGLLSVEPFNWFARSPVTVAEREAVSGGPVAAEAMTLERLRAAARTLSRTSPVRELDAVQFRGELFWAAEQAPSLADAGRWRNAGLLPRASLPRLPRQYVPVAQPEAPPFSRFPREAVEAAAADAADGRRVLDATWVEAYDAYYYDPRGTRALPVLRVRYDDPADTWLYLDPERGGIALKSDRVSRTRRWLYQGFHSLDLPLLYYRRPLWDLIVILLSAGGFLLAATTVLPAGRRLARHARSIAARVPRIVASRPPASSSRA